MCICSMAHKLLLENRTMNFVIFLQSLKKLKESGPRQFDTYDDDIYEAQTSAAVARSIDDPLECPSSAVLSVGNTLSVSARVVPTAYTA